MPHHDRPWAPGTPCWIDASFDDPHRATRFYGHLFGWEAGPAGPPESGHYTVLLKHHRPVAALASPSRGPVAWGTYLATDDIEATAERARAAGATFSMEPMQIFDAGSMAILTDPSGAEIRLWQGLEHLGFGLVEEPGSVVWTDLMTRDLDAAREFYTSVFDVTASEAGPGYLTLDVDGRPVAGLHRAEHLPDDAPPHWLAHVAVADLDSAIGLVEMEDGAGVLMRMDSPYGPEAVVRGPEGEVFAMIQMNDTADDGSAG